MVLVLEVGVEFDYVGVVELVVYFELVEELILHLVLFYCGFEYFLDGTEETCGLVHANIDIPKFTRTYALPQLEISNIESWEVTLSPIRKQIARAA